MHVASDPEANSFDCPRCRWSDQQKYAEHIVNEWAPNEPSSHKVCLVFYYQFYITIILHNSFSNYI